MFAKYGVFRRLALVTPQVLSYVASLLIAFRLGIGKGFDEWVLLYTPPAIFSGIVNLKLVRDLSHSARNERRFNIYLRASILFLLLNALAFAIFVRRPEIAFQYGLVAISFLPLIWSGIPMITLWKKGLFVQSSIASSVYPFLFGLLAFLMLGHLPIYKVAILSVAVSGAFCLGLTVAFVRVAREQEFSSKECETGVSAPSNRTARLGSLVNSATMLSERILLDQYILSVFPKAGILSIYFFVSRLLNAAFNLYSGIFLPEMRREAANRSGDSARAAMPPFVVLMLQRHLKRAAVVSALAIIVAFSSSFSAIRASTLDIQHVSALVLVGFVPPILLSMILMIDTIFPLTLTRQVRLLWIVDVAGRAGFYLMKSVSGYLLWSCLLSLAQLLLFVLRQRSAKFVDRVV